MGFPPRRFASRFDAWARTVADESSERVTKDLVAAIQGGMHELSRMLRQQGDATNELAETFGRRLTVLSEAIEELQARLDRMEAAEGHPTRSL